MIHSVLESQGKWILQSSRNHDGPFGQGLDKEKMQENALIIADQYEQMHVSRHDANERV